MKYLILPLDELIVQHSAKTKPKNQEWTFYRANKTYYLRGYIEKLLLKNDPGLEWYLRVGHLNYLKLKT